MRVLGQTLFLGASVVSYNANVGWGGSASSLQVELIEDVQPFGKAPFRKFNQNKTADYGDLDLKSIDPLPVGHPGDRTLGPDFYRINHYNQASYPDNHYYNCVGDDCYIDELGRPISSLSKEKNVPGKIYYEWVNNRFVSKYWYAEDPGFFATGTRIDPNGEYKPNLSRDLDANNLYIYDIINTPVYFKFDNFEFIGLVKSWERNLRPGGLTYTVTIESFDSLLDNCHIILQNFNGAIFGINSSITSLDDLLSQLNNNDIGGPVNFPVENINFSNSIARGAIPNVFNVFGFLESMGFGGFGGSKLNSQGLRFNDIIDALQVLTSSQNTNLRTIDKAFSPFHRIISKNIASANTGIPIRNFNSFGIISSNGPQRSRPDPAPNYNKFCLDLTSFPRAPDNYRVQGNPSISISSFIKQACDDLGLDFFVVTIPVAHSDRTDFVIKIITVDRTNYNPIYQIPNTISLLEEQGGLEIENSSFGQEKNNNYTRKLVFGPNQQRLFQVKNYRLSYSQNNLVYNTITRQFINLQNNIPKNNIGKARNPELSSTRNKLISDFVNTSESQLFLRDDIDADNRFSVPINDWGDTEIGREENIVKGNYKDTYIENNVSTINNRFVYLLNDIISPYFGARSEKKFPVGGESNEFRLPRPVFLDTWTNEITVSFNLDELPTLSIGEPLSLYDNIQPNSSGIDTGGGLNQSATISSNQKSTVNPTNFGGVASSGINPTRTLNYSTPGFTIKETEFRCPNIDSYLTYCLSKSIYSKPDLFVMLVNAYKARGIFLSAPSSNSVELTGEGLAGIGGNVTSNVNNSNNGIPSDAVPGFRTKLDINWDLYLDHNFIKDLQIIFNFIKSISDQYYGKKYVIKSPDLYAYKDIQYGFQLPSNVGDISVFQGSSEIFYNYEITDGAWEEYGNYIDDSIICGDPNWHILTNEVGLIPTIIGYNNSSNIDDVTRFWCELSKQNRRRQLFNQVVANPDSITLEQIKRVARDNFDCTDTKKISIPSIEISSLDPESFVVVNKTTSNIDAFGRKVPSSKLYIKTSSDKIIFLDPINLTNPRIIVDAPGVDIASQSLSYTTDPNLSVISNVAIEDFCILSRLTNSISSGTNPTLNAREIQYLSYLLSFVYPINNNRLVPKGPSVNASASNAAVNPKKATPSFIGVPIKSNTAVYGPWINYPGLVMTGNLADNLIGNLKIEQNSDYAPWIYGGMSALDKVVSYSMNSDINYQNILENGRISIVGPPVFGIGGIFNITNFINISLYKNNNNYIIFDNNYYELYQNTVISFIDVATGGVIHNYRNISLGQNNYGSSPLVSNISIQTSDNGIKTSYSFQTYSPKTGLFNKQFSDNIKEQNLINLKFNKSIANRNNRSNNALVNDINSILSKAKESREPYSIARHATQLFGTSPVELIVGQRSEFVPVPSGTQTLDEFNRLRRSHHWIGIIPGVEVGSELMSDYDSKASMTIDGLLSPISFFPTRLNGTYSITSYSGNQQCPRCGNERKISVEYIDYSISTRPKNNIEIPCPVCSKSILNHDNKEIKKETAKNLISPIENINLYSLNPIVMRSGLFSNPHISQPTNHSILALSRGEKLPTNNKSFLLSSNINDKQNTDYINDNQRFFALRGPLMLHAWGFDTDGYPVPNASGEPLELDNKNRPKRFVLTDVGLNDFSKDGKFLPENTERLGDIIPKNYEFIGGKWKKKIKDRASTFHANWAQRPDLWPIGPIDLRWDHKRKVWDASGGGCKEEILPPFIITNKADNNTLQEFLNNRNETKCPYKMVYITLEQDMIKEENFESTHPTRGFIDDIEYSKEPLQNNFRRLVYVIDTAGYTAPRGAKLLCRYNRDNGFYEPITKPILTALGSIRNNNQASIDMSYTQGRRSNTIPRYITNFANPLNLTPGEKGLFNFINGKWTLISAG
jgi:hypothetical protein